MALPCPLCKRAMVALQCGAIEIDFCRLGCKGLWLDAGELTALDLPTHALEAALREALNAPRRMRPPGPLTCARCGRRMTVARYRTTRVQIDQCQSCGGIFLDAGELQAIRTALGGAGRPAELQSGDLEPPPPTATPMTWRSAPDPARRAPLAAPPLARNLVKQEKLIDLLFLSAATLALDWTRSRRSHSSSHSLLRQLWRWL